MVNAVGVIHVNVVFFASLREIAGCPSLDLELPEGSTVRDAWAECVTLWPALASRRATTVVAVNREFSRADVLLHAGDELALLPPVSGGR
jgi:molybdopterin converting factor subunit 1